MKNPFVIPAGIQATVDQIMADSRARFGHDLFRMEDTGGGAGGGAGGGGDTGGAGGAGEPGAGDPADGTLGDAGKQAIDRMKAERNAATKRAAAAEAELEKLRTAGLSEQERAVSAARKEGETEATKRANDRIVRSEAKVLAATAKFRDPGDVIAQLGTQLADITVDDDGEVDQKALKKLVDDLATAKPYLLDTGSTTATAADAGIGTTGSQQTADPGPGRARLAAAYATSSTTKS